jgi:hypothetical protein
LDRPKESYDLPGTSLFDVEFYSDLPSSLEGNSTEPTEHDRNFLANPSLFIEQALTGASTPVIESFAWKNIANRFGGDVEGMTILRSPLRLHCVPTSTWIRRSIGDSIVWRLRGS